MSASIHLLITGLLACGGGDDGGTTDSPTVPEAPDTTGTTGGGGEPAPPEIAVMTFDASFGVDVDGVVIPATVVGYDLPAAFNVLLGEDGWLGDTSDTNSYCVVTFELDGATNAEWAVGLPAWYGIDVDTSGGATSCDDLQLPDGADVLSFVADNTFEVAIGTEASADVTDFLDDYWYPDTTYGASVTSGLFNDDEYSSDCWGTSYTMDDSGEVLVDDDDYFIPQLLVSLPLPYGGVAPGYYTVNHMWIWNL